MKVLIGLLGLIYGLIDKFNYDEYVDEYEDLDDEDSDDAFGEDDFE